MDANNRPGLPLSLQDMCMLCIMLRLEEFPTDSLALLPSAIRRRLFLGLAHADLLHVDTEVLFGDLDYSGLDPRPSREDHRQRGPAVAREKLLDVILHANALPFFSLDLEAALDCYQWVKSTRDGEFDLIEHICKCYPSLEATMVSPDPNLYFIENGDFHQYLGGVLPKRLSQFVVLHQHVVPLSCTLVLQVPLELAQPLLKYCKMQRAPQNLLINCWSFQRTMFWKEDFSKKIEEYCDRLRIKSPIEKMGPVIPFLQEFLSSVEVLELDTDLSTSTPNAIHTVVYVILYNIVTSSQPRLKHLKIRGLIFLNDWVSDLFFKKKSKESVIEAMYTFVPLATNLSHPYPLEGLSVLPHWLDYVHLIKYKSSIISSYVVEGLIQSLVECHMHTLKHVVIQGISLN